MGGLFITLLIIIVIAIITTGVILLIEYFENKKIKFVLSKIETISKDNDNKKLKSCVKTITNGKMKN